MDFLNNAFKAAALLFGIFAAISISIYIGIVIYNAILDFKESRSDPLQRMKLRPSCA